MKLLTTVAVLTLIAFSMPVLAQTSTDNGGQQNQKHHHHHKKQQSGGQQGTPSGQ